MPGITPANNYICFDEVNQAVFDYCGGYNDYSLKYSRVAASLCNYTNQESEKIIAHLKTQCVA